MREAEELYFPTKKIFLLQYPVLHSIVWKALTDLSADYLTSSRHPLLVDATVLPSAGPWATLSSSPGFSALSLVLFEHQT